MDIHVNYVTDSLGRRRSVQLSMADWKKVQKQLLLAEVKEQLRDAFAEIREIEAGRLEPLSLEEGLAQIQRELDEENGR